MGFRTKLNLADSAFLDIHSNLSSDVHRIHHTFNFEVFEVLFALYFDNFEMSIPFSKISKFLFTIFRNCDNLNLQD